ncbi:spondin domain-containing protein [Grimontia marina]|nr:spondin domain-containing protein [Grimontia marina]
MVAAFTAQAANVDVKITNATDGIYFTPLIVAAHSPDAYLFRTGEAASADLEAMAEGGEGFNAARDDIDRLRIHPGVLSADEGLEDSALKYRHRFLNPGAKVTIKRVW